MNGQNISKPDLMFVCSPNNDLYRVVVNSWNVKIARRDDPIQAVHEAPTGSGVLILADGYPTTATPLNPNVFKQSREKDLRLYVEYPSELPEIELGEPTETDVERAVVCSEFFGEELSPLQILAINELHYLPAETKNAHLVAAQVAGFDYAVYDLPEDPARIHPLLFELTRQKGLVATTKLSHFVTGRYTPSEAWKVLWQRLLTWLNEGRLLPEIQWEPIVKPTFNREEPLPSDAERRAIQRGIDWFNNSKMIKHTSHSEEIEDTDGRRTFLPSSSSLTGNGNLGSSEGILSIIRQDGCQPISVTQRGDCMAETAMALSFGDQLLTRPSTSRTASNLLDYYLFESPARKNERANPEHGAYGLISWGISTPKWYTANYGDDNARLILAVLATAALTDTDRWDEAIMMCLLANLRTTGQLGFRGERIDLPELDEHGWQYFFDRRIVNYAPHFEAYLWACYLWAYEQTGYTLFLDRAETAIRMTMDQYPDGWDWTNGLSQEKARMVLPLAWQLRVKETEENRAMLQQVVDDLLELQNENGAIREELGQPGAGMFPPPKTNEDYGTNEAPLIAEDGDPIADLLYTNNFALLGMHEAAECLNDPKVDQACDDLAEFLCQIQICSETRPSLDGGWFRSFDFERWEHWGSNADNGWGAWVIESGGTQGWIISVMAMRQLNTTLWEVTNNSQIDRHFDRLRHQMIPDQ